MIKIENVTMYGLQEAIRGMRNPKNSWEKSDSFACTMASTQAVCANCEYEKRCRDSFVLGDNDRKLMRELAAGGSVHAKYRRMITLYLDITAPLYWWKEFDTYKVGTVVNSCSTMHKIHEKEFVLDDFSIEHLISLDDCLLGEIAPKLVMDAVIQALNVYRKKHIETNDKKYWWQLIQLLPSSYNQRRTVMLNYEVLAGIYPMRKDHKLDEWREFCKWIETLPYSEIIFGKNEVKSHG